MRVAAELVSQIDWRGNQFTCYSGGPGDSLCLLLEPGGPVSSRRVLCFTKSAAWEHTVETGQGEFHFVQPLPEGLLLAHARQRGDAPNGQVFDLDGQLIRELALGDGIQDIQTTKSGRIWTSYFDEGAYGKTIGSAGLVCFDRLGTSAHDFQPSSGLDKICGCYALNVATEDTVWFYYYTQFPLVRLRKGRVDGVWQPGIRGAHSFAVLGDLVVMHSGYGEQDWQCLRLQADGSVKHEGRLDFVDEDGDPLPVRCARARGSLIWFLQNSKVYRADLRDLS